MRRPPGAGGTATTAGNARRVAGRTLAALLTGVLGSRRACYVAELLDARHMPVLVSAGELDPYGAEALADEIAQSHGGRIDLFVDVFADVFADAFADVGAGRAPAAPLGGRTPEPIELAQSGVVIHVHQ